MSIYKIADITMSISPMYEYTKNILFEFLSTDDKAVVDFDIPTITKEEIEHEHKVAKEKVTDAVCESVAILRKICEKILSYNGFFFHCSCLEIDGRAVIFTGKSGTGKSTHAKLWREFFKDRVSMINDDKPLIRKVDENFYVCGTPWKGKHRIGYDKCAKISAIYVLHQAKENRCEKKDTISALSSMLSQTVIPNDKSSMSSLLSLLSDVIKSIPIYDLYCDISEDAVKTAYKNLGPI